MKIVNPPPGVSSKSYGGGEKEEALHSGNIVA